MERNPQNPTTASRISNRQEEKYSRDMGQFIHGNVSHEDGSNKSQMYGQQLMVIYKSKLRKSWQQIANSYQSE